jgi:hypothetical protein
MVGSLNFDMGKNTENTLLVDEGFGGGIEELKN